MDEKISLKAVDQYSEAYAANIVSHFFVGKEKITGPEILDLCDIKQINLFVLRELMHMWRVESQKLKSSFFNYQAKEVSEALAHFQNTLSNHISISKSDFLPLLKKAVSQTLYLVLGPYDFYSDTLDRHGQGAINVVDLRSDIKYLRINQPPLEKLVQKLEEKKLVTISGNEAFALLDSILEEVNFTPEDIEGYLSEFSKVAPLELEKLYEQKTIHKPAQKQVLVNKEEAVTTSRNRETKTLADNFQKIARIKDSLTINQKFMFTKILFGGDFGAFSKVIDRIDTLDNLSQALSYLESDYSEWDRETEEYGEFIEMVETRFA
jgi:hypothetical protein